MTMLTTFYFCISWCVSEMPLKNINTSFHLHNKGSPYYYYDYFIVFDTYLKWNFIYKTFYHHSFVCLLVECFFFFYYQEQDNQETEKQRYANDMIII